ncbi:(2Fe-2S)-binding protein [Tepidibacter aestuarii]|uniref:(2Fe-2S)-binding protein n=1 Tax=Tepidibacter aestuarii TaxID=2925782 RepID=UPI0020BED752|nr:(2Fe-2S)-binding protein [Tepidibacter aestuarii]CAH2214692.1 bacterioferritin-associated ferredoxin [Tepidibacter aestuarii]
MSVVCNCFGTTEEEIREAIKKGANTVEAVGEETSAGTGCGACQSRIQEIIDEETK